MTILKVLKYPDPRLRTVAKPVVTFDETLKQLIDDMFATMYQENGIGLAATQVNVHQRVMVIDLQEAEQQNPQYLINPEILERKGETLSQEGCLSVPGAYDYVKRAEWIRYQTCDQLGQVSTHEATGLLANCIQHEIDHLNGVLFFDHLSAIKRARIKKKLVALNKHQTS